MKLDFKKVFPVVLAFLSIADLSFATDGYFLTGYGTKQQGQGGAGVAKPSDSLAGATNPASLFLVGNRFDIGLTLFRPVRNGTITGNQLPAGYPNVNGTYDGNRVKNFELPELGYSLRYRPNLVLGVALYGNGLHLAYPRIQGGSTQLPRRCRKYRYTAFCRGGIAVYRGHFQRSNPCDQ
jgi:hypothetical protein